MHLASQIGQEPALGIDPSLQEQLNPLGAAAGHAYRTLKFGGSITVRISRESGISRAIVSAVSFISKALPAGISSVSVGPLVEP